MASVPFAFLDGALDRADHLRDDADALTALWPQARVVLLDDEGRALADARSAHGGLLVVKGDASLRCGISLKGGDIVIGGGVGDFSAFMAQAGRMVICGDAGHALGDSLYEAVIYVRGQVASLGADARFEDMAERDYAAVAELLGKAGLAHDAREFKRVASAKGLYHWNADSNQEY